MRTFDVANGVRFEGAERYEVVRDELEAFRQRWHIQQKDLVHILDLPLGTLDSIYNDKKSFYVMKENVDKIRSGIRNYDPRTCIYRRIPKDEATRWLNRVRDNHGLTWKETSEAVDYSDIKLRQITSPKSRQKYVTIEDMRHMMISYNNWLIERGRRLGLEGVA